MALMTSPRTGQQQQGSQRLAAEYQPGMYLPPPTIDPSRAAIDALDEAKSQWRRELGQLDANHMAVIKNQLALVSTRLDAMDHATDLRLKVVNEIPHATALLVSTLERLHAEKFDSIGLQFRERDIRTEQAAIASKQALDAALLAAKELVGQQNSANVDAATKAETNFTKQIDQISVLIATLEKALTDRILELKERIDRGEGGQMGARVERVDIRDSDAALRQVQGQRRETMLAMLSVISVLLVFVSIGVAIYAAIKP